MKLASILGITLLLGCSLSCALSKTLEQGDICTDNSTITIVPSFSSAVGEFKIVHWKNEKGEEQLGNYVPEFDDLIQKGRKYNITYRKGSYRQKDSGTMKIDWVSLILSVQDGETVIYKRPEKKLPNK